MTPGAWWNGIGGMSWFRTMRIPNRTWAWNYCTGGSLLEEGGSELLIGWVNSWFHSDFEARGLWNHILERRDSGYP
jgi:hypothetical protein